VQLAGGSHGFARIRVKKDPSPVDECDEGRTGVYMGEPSIKGIALRSAVSDVAGLVESGRVSLEELQLRLTEEDLALVETGVSDSTWYPIGIYGRMLRLLFHVEGAGLTSYLERRGAAFVGRLAEAGIYQQVDFLERVRDPAGQENVDDVIRYMNLVLTLWSVGLNFVRYRVERHPHLPLHVRIIVSDAADLPDEVVHVIAGALKEGFLRADRKVTLSATRHAPDVVHYVVDLSPTLSG
jgi:hypothetical protein